jgi:shikimate kinase
MERLAELGTVVWLSSDFATVFARASRVGGRPMLAGRSAEEAAALFQARQDYYRRAHLAVDTTHQPVDAVVNRIVRYLRERDRATRAAGAPPGDADPPAQPAAVGEPGEGDG